MISSSVAALCFVYLFLYCFTGRFHCLPRNSCDCASAFVLLDHFLFLSVLVAVVLMSSVWVERQGPHPPAVAPSLSSTEGFLISKDLFMSQRRVESDVREDRRVLRICSVLVANIIRKM